jgi:threonine dehydratase
MPETSRKIKVDAVRAYGGRITFCEPTLAAREETAARLVAETGAVLIHPYDNDAVIAGQGTAACEMLARVPDLDLLITPVGGGGLLSGTLLCAKSLRPDMQVWAGEPQGADDAYRGWKSGQWVASVNPHTIADGLLTSLGRRNFEVIQRWVDQIVLVNDEDIVGAVRLLYDAADLVVEPSGAVPLAALLARRDEVHGRKLGVILSGGNVDLSELDAVA